MPTDDGIKCKLCSADIGENEASDLWCYGCKSYICGDHIFSPWGGHQPEDHDMVTEER